VSLDEVAAELRAVLETIRQQRATTAETISLVTATHHRMLLLTQGSRHPLVFKLLSAWKATQERLREADQMLAGAARTLVKYMQTIGVDVGSAGAAAASGSGTLSPDSIPAFIAEAAARLTHRKKTVGSAFDQDGQPLIGQDIMSGGELEPGIPPTDTRLRRDGKWHRLESARTHVEGKVAAKMRKDGQQRVSVIVTRPPCPGPDGCRVRLRQVLPAGATLTVYVANPDGTARYFDTFLGTGEAVSS
jgi:hypothetical protein